MGMFHFICTRRLSLVSLSLYEQITLNTAEPKCDEMCSTS